MGRILTVEEALRGGVPLFGEGVRMGGVFAFIFRDKFGREVDRDLIPWHNLVVTEGRGHVSSVIFGGGTQVNPWYIGLCASSPTPAAGDTLASHAGWTEFTDYSGTRKEFVETITGAQADNSASVATFVFTGNGTVGGGFLCSVASGTSGVLYSVGIRSGGDRAVETSESMEVTYTHTVSDDGV